MLDADRASIAEAKINAITNALKDGELVLDYTTEDNKTTMEEIYAARTAYDALPDSAKKLVSETATDLLKKYEKAVEISLILEDLEGFEDLDKAGKDALNTVYENAKKALEDLKNSEEFDYQEIRDLVPNNYNYGYQEASKYFDGETEE